MIRDLSYLVISDIHLGHKNTSAFDIIQHLDTFFDHYRNNTEYSNLDIIFIAGDLFDRLLDFNSKDIHEATIWIDRLMKFCEKHDIILRVLEGTPSHDWKQSKIVDTLKDVNHNASDVRYIDTLHIEYIESLDLSILYVPDEWTASTELTFTQVEELLKEKNLIDVDIAIMHGCFNYQVQHIPVKLDAHDENKYLGIVKYFINIGHFHSFSTYNRIIAQGSFDRLTHGEEEPKGGVIVNLYKDTNKSPDFVFIENKRAKIYKTIAVRFKDLEQALRSLYKQLNEIPKNSFIRIKAKKDHPIYSAIDEIKLMYPALTFTKVTEESLAEDKAIIDSNMFHDDYIPVAITPENIIDLVTSEIETSYDFTEDQMSTASNILKRTLSLVTN